METLLGIGIVGLVFVLYWLPWMISMDKQQSCSVGVINLFLGWTFIGWVVALAMAVAPDSKRAV